MTFPGFGFTGYRCLNGDPQWIPMGPGVTVFLGGNNSGKSTTLWLIYKHLDAIYAAIRGGDAIKGFDARLDRPRGQGIDQRLEVHWPIDVERFDTLRLTDADVDALLSIPSLGWTGTLTIPLSAPDLTAAPDITEEATRAILDEAPGVNWGHMSSRLTNSAGGSRGADTQRVLQTLLAKAAIPPPERKLVPPDRGLKAGAADGAEWDLGGEGMIARLHAMQNPQFDEDQLRELNEKIVRDLARLLEDDHVRFQVPGDLTTVTVRLGGQYFPLASVGTGTEHALLILTAHHVYPDHVLCLEEPDAHFHPRLQRNLMSLLRESSGRSILIATHSAHVIDGSDTVIAIRHESGRSTLTAAGDPGLFGQLRALGYRASDLLQANSIIWVEGPSDRIYLLHWLAAMDEDIREGVDFSIAFYGGALLKRLSAAVSGPTEPTLVDLWRINQRMWLLMDADVVRGEELRPDVQRLQREIEEAGRGGTWVTGGYTMENYVPHEMLLEAVQDVHTSVVQIQRPRRDRNPLAHLIRRNGSVLRDVDKVAIAVAVVQREAVIDVLDLRERLEDLVAFIRSGE